MHEATTEQSEQAARRAETRRILERMIDDLPNSIRPAFMLRALERMTVEETALCLNISEVTVRTRYFWAKGLLRDALCLEIDCAFEDAFSFDGARCNRIVATTLSRLKKD